MARLYNTTGARTCTKSAHLSILKQCQRSLPQLRALLFRNALFQFLEQRAGLVELCAGLQVAGPPLLFWMGLSPIQNSFVAQHAVLAQLVLYSFCVLFTKQRRVVIEEGVQLFRRERQEGREHDLERIDGLERGVDAQG